MTAPGLLPREDDRKGDPYALTVDDWSMIEAALVAAYLAERGDRTPLWRLHSKALVQKMRAK